MLTNSPFYAGLAVDDLAKAKEFYGQTLGVRVDLEKRVPRSGPYEHR